VRPARENLRWGYGKIQGELGKLGQRVGRSTVRDVLKRHGIRPAPERQRRGGTWAAFLRRHLDQTLACDFFTTVETLGLRTLMVLFFIELGSRRVHLAGCTGTPAADWVRPAGAQPVLGPPGRDAPDRLRHVPAHR